MPADPSPAAGAAAGGGATPPAPATLGEIMQGFEKLPWFWQLAILAAIAPIFRGLMGPVSVELANAGNRLLRPNALSPADAASAVVRGFLPVSGSEGLNAVNEAARGGYDAERFQTLVRLAGESLAPGDAAVALRRGIIPEDSGDPDRPGYLQAIRQGNLRDMWAPVIRQLATQQPSPPDVLDAVLTGQLSYEDGKALYAAVGGALAQEGVPPAARDLYDLMYRTRGQPPTPNEALALAQRGIIAWGPDVRLPQSIDEMGQSVGAAETYTPDPSAVTYEQAFLEGSWRNKWLNVFAQLGVYVPPERTIVTLYRDAAITKEQAEKLLRMNGMTPDLAAAYIQSATMERTAGTRLAAASLIQQMYENNLITAAQAEEGLMAYGYSKADADLILAVADLTVENAKIKQVMSRLKTLYTTYKISRTDAINSMNALHMDPKLQEGALQAWDLERAANRKLPTESQITSAFFYGVITQEQAMLALEQQGYSPFDAWLILSARAHAKLPNMPPQTQLIPPEVLAGEVKAP